MPSDTQFVCKNEDCDKDFHKKQAFISHSSQDKELAETIAGKGCEIGIASYLFEFSPDNAGQIPPCDALAQRVVDSDVVFVLLGKSMSEAYWTQAWIGFEIGVSRGAEIIGSREPTVENLYSDRTNKVIAIQDVRQGIEVCLPSLDAILLFDFNADAQWDQYKNMAWVVTKLGSLEEFFRIGNDFQQHVLKADVKCENVKCKSEYEAWIPIEDAGKLGKGCNQTSGPPRIQAECTIECPSCDQMVTRIFTQMLLSNVHI